MEWKPGASRNRRALEDPYVGVPDHLRRPLWAWVGDSLEWDRFAVVALNLRVDIDTSYGMVEPLQKLERTSHPHILLDTIEALLELFGWDDGRADRLSAVLRLGNSAYTVRKDYRGLEERVTQGVKDLVTETVKSATSSAGEHLTAAWNAAYGRSPDPVKAYSEAIKAAESALAPVISPQNDKQTLGTMIRDVDSKASKWTFVIRDRNTSSVGTVLNMMRTLWDGQTSRHGGMQQTRAETLEEARAAVHLAASLAQFGVSRALDATP